MARDDFIIAIDDDNNRLNGSKWNNLCILAKTGVNIPSTYCVTTNAYEHFIDVNNLGQIIQKTLQDDQLISQVKAQKLISSILAGNIPEDIRAGLAGHDFLARLDAQWAVRSSSNLEDLPNTSFAGLYDSFLNIQGLDNILTSIKKCWASLWNERAIVYRERNALGHAECRMAVIIQEMIESQYAGVIFTKHPSAERQNEMFMEYCEGLGEGLVSGMIAPYSCRIQRSSQAIAHLDVPETRTFSDDHIHELSNLALDIEKHFGCPQDIEWAFDGSSFYILQSRPISDSNRLRRIPAETLWTRANIGEVLPKVITPLTWDIFRATLMNRPDLAMDTAEMDTISNERLRQIFGRGYLRLDSFLNSFCYLPFVTPKVMSRVLGIDLPSLDQCYSRPRGIGVKLAQTVFVLNAIRILPRLSWLINRLPPLPDKDRENIKSIIMWNAKCFQLHLKCTAYSIGTFAFLSRLLDRWLPSESESLLPLILIGNKNLQTAAQGISLWELSLFVRRHPVLRDILENDVDQPFNEHQVADVENGAEFLSMFQAFLDVNGARAAEEFELAVPRWREDPSFVVNVIRKFLETQTDELKFFDPGMRLGQRQKAISRIKRSLRPIQRLAFIQLLTSYADFCTLRENIKYRLMEGYSLLRGIFLEMGAVLESRGMLENANDIFFLRLSEVVAWLQGKQLEREALGLISQRKAQYAIWVSQDAPNLISIDGNEEPSKADEEGLNGIGCSPGVAEGFARVLLDISEAGTLKPGEILVTPHTDPGWTPLFLSCKAIVTEIGGFLSHGATVAREYGIPAVVNVKGATSKINTGNLIRVDGSKGIVAIQR